MRKLIPFLDNFCFLIKAKSTERILFKKSSDIRTQERRSWSGLRLMEAFSFRFIFYMGFPGSSVGKESTCNAGVAGDEGLIPGLGRGHGNLLQCSCLENSMDR